ncbi:CARDB domain-containing protein, partial [Corallococcus exercitus]
VQELNEDNNAFIQGRVGTGPEADLVITDVRAPANLVEGQSFTATYTVCNRGNTLAHDYGVSLFLSTETNPPVSRPPPAPPVFAELQRAYAFLGRALPYATLAAGQCTTERSTFTALRPPDAMPSPFERPLHLSAVVDSQGPEPRTDNNGFAAGIVGLGIGPDLVITELQGPASVRPWGSFTSTVKVCNVGTGMMNSGAYVDVYVSVDDTLPAPDPLAPPGPLPMGSHRFVGSALVPPLSAGACATRQIAGSADLPPYAIPFRPLYLGAVVYQGSTPEELRRDNNTRVAGPLSVGNGPDLVVTSVEAPGTVAPYEPFAATVRVCNVGTDSVNPTEVALVVSAEETWALPPQGSPAPFPGPDQFLAGFVNVAPLQAGQCVSAMGMMSAGQPPGASSPGQPLSLSAAVDPFQNQPELREDNNVFVKGRLGVGWEADLVITALTPPASIRPGQPFTTTLTVCNQGSQPSSNDALVTLHLLTVPELSLPAQGTPPPPQDEFLGEFFIPQLAAHTCGTTPVTGNFYGAPWQERTYYVGATLDRTWSTPEVRKDNNTFVGPRVGVGSAPDLVITAVGGPENIAPYGQAPVSVTVCNQGTQPSFAQRVELFFTTEPTPPEPPIPGRPVDPASGVSLVGTVDIPPLPENACITREDTLHASPPASGPEAPLFLAAIVRAPSPLDELRTDNNAFMRGRIGVGYAPDLVVTEVTAPFAVRGGEMFLTTVTVCNQGTQPSWGNSQVEVLLSTQPTLAFQGGMPGSSSTQVTLGELDVGELSAQQCTTRQLFTSTDTLPGYQSSGLFYLGALVDSQQSVMELREDNNAFVEGFLAVLP